MNWEAFWKHPYWDYFDKVGIAVALLTTFITMVFSVLIWLHQKRKEKRDNALIHIRLRCDNPAVTITLQGQIRRKDLTRAEILGLLGMLPMKTKGQRYELSNLNKQVFFDELEDAQINSLITEVIIPFQQDELLQFDYTKLREVCDIQGELPSQ